MATTYNRHTVEYKSDYDKFAVYGWTTYSPSSVLAGQPCKQFLDTFDTQEAALIAHPDATPSNRWMEPVVSLAHLSGGD